MILLWAMEMLLGMSIAIFLFTQVVVPSLLGKSFFPLFKKGKVEKELADAEGYLEEVRIKKLAERVKKIAEMEKEG